MKDIDMKRFKLDDSKAVPECCLRYEIDWMNG